MIFEVMDADYRDAEGNTSDGMYTAIEFKNANGKELSWQSVLRAHRDMVEMFQGIEGITLARYDYKNWASDEDGDVDFGLTIIVRPELEPNIKKAAEILGLPVYCINEIDDEALEKIENGEEECQIGVDYDVDSEP